MDIDRGFMYAVLRDGSARKLFESNVSQDMFRGEGATVYKFVTDFYQNNMALPSIESVREFTGVNLEAEAKEPFDFWLGEMRERHIYGVIRDGIGVAADLMGRKQASKAMEVLDRMLGQARKESLGTIRVVNLFSMVDRVIERYEKLKAGHLGIITPWDKMNEHTLGWQPEDFILFVARSKVGKTVFMMLMAKHAWFHKHKVLFVSTEMSHESITRRFIAMHMRLPYGLFRRGKMGEFLERENFPKMLELKKESGFYLFGEDFELSVPHLKVVLSEFKPDILFIDGAYLLRVPGVTDRFERAPIIADEIKMMAKRYKIPVIASMQFSRKAVGAKDDDIDDSMTSLSDSFSWNVDAMFALMRQKPNTEKGEADRREMKVKCLLIREGEPFEFLTHWDFETMNFSEKPEAKPDNKDDVAGLVSVY